MARIRIVGPRPLLSQAVGRLQELGTIHIDAAPAGIREIQDQVPVLRRHALDPAALAARESLETALDAVRKILLVLPVPPAPLPGGGGVPDLSPPDADARSLRELSRELDALDARAAALVAGRKAREDELSLFSRYDKVLDALSPLIALVRESRELECTGLVIQAQERDVAPVLTQALARLTAGNYEIIYREVDKDTLAALLVFPKEKAAEAKALLYGKNIGELRLPAAVADKPVGEAFAIIRTKQRELPAEIRRIDDELLDLARTWREPLLRLRLWLENRVERIRTSSSFYETRMTFLLYGWVPRAALDGVRNSLAASFGPLVVVEELPIGRSEEEAVPVALRNRPCVRPFEILTGVLPLPRYGTIDPTPLVAVFFPLFYGAIIGDVGYGLLLFGIALYARRRFRSHPLFAGLASIYAVAALSAVAWGFAFGELFGDLGERAGIAPPLIRRMKDFRATMALAVAIGASHVLLGIGLGVYTAARRRRRGEAVARAAGFVLVVSSLVLLAGLAGALPPPAVPAGAAVLVACLPILFVSGGPKAAMELHNLMNVFSYLRIMGVGVASVALAYAANRIAFAAGPPLVVVPAAIALHAINLAFGVLSPAIQSMRLHYVEFFENFFVGGGRAYKPFKSVA